MELGCVCLALVAGPIPTEIGLMTHMQAFWVAHNDFMGIAVHVGGRVMETNTSCCCVC